MMNIMTRYAPLVAGLMVTGCDYTGDFLFPQPVETVPGIQDLGQLEPTEWETLDEIRASAKFGEIGATGTADVGGMSFTFTGTGRDVCVFVDPETVSWTQSVSRTNPVAGFTWPDNLLDDGDIDLFAGVSVYYSGSPGQEIGGFEVRYQDALGNEIPVEFNECSIIGTFFPGGGGHSGRAMPEYCTLTSTQTGVDYTVVLETFSSPADDDRLGFGLVFLDGPCSDVDNLINSELLNNSECLLLGESINPAHAHDYRDAPFLVEGQENLGSFTWPASDDVEKLFCSVYAAQSSLDLRKYCEEEETSLRDNLLTRAACNDGTRRCYCGDMEESPNANQ